MALCIFYIQLFFFLFNRESWPKLTGAHQQRLSNTKSFGLSGTESIKIFDKIFNSRECNAQKMCDSAIWSIFLSASLSAAKPSPAATRKAVYTQPSPTAMHLPTMFHTAFVEKNSVCAPSVGNGRGLSCHRIRATKRAPAEKTKFSAQLSGARGKHRFKNGGDSPTTFKCHSVSTKTKLTVDDMILKFLCTENTSQEDVDPPNQTFSNAPQKTAQLIHSTDNLMHKLKRTSAGALYCGRRKRGGKWICHYTTQRNFIEPYIYLYKNWPTINILSGALG